MILAVVVSSIMGMIMVEVCSAIFSSHWFQQRLFLIEGLAGAFRSAKDDDERQHLLLKGGCDLLGFSLTCLAVLLALLGFAISPGWLMGWSDQQDNLHFAVMSLVAFGWWWVRSRLRKSGRN